MTKRIGWLALQVVCIVILLGISIHGVMGEDEDGGSEIKVSLDQVPAKVKTAILKSVGTGKLVDIGKISKDGKTFYEIEMWIDGVEYDVLFDAEGKVLKREREENEDEEEEGEEEEGGVEKKVSIDQVPAKVKAAILEAVGKGKLVDIGEITTKDGKKFYEIEMWLDGVEYDVLFDAGGKLLNKEAEEGEDEDGDDDDEDDDDDD